MSSLREPTDSREFTRAEGLALCLSMIGVQLSSEVLNQWGLYFYSPSEGVGRTIYVAMGLVGIIFVTGTLWDAITDPLIGTWSDRTKSTPGLFRRFRPSGRRRPFIFWGSILMTFTAIAFWYPPVEGTSTVNLVYGTILLCLHWTMFTITVVPLVSLPPEIARSEAARVRLGTWTAVGMIVGLGMAAVLPGQLIVLLDPARTDARLSIVVRGALDAGQAQRMAAAVSPDIPNERFTIVEGDEQTTLQIAGEAVADLDAAAARGAVSEIAGEQMAAFDYQPGSFSPKGYRRLAAVMAFVSLVLLQLPVWVVHERYDSTVAGAAKDSFIEGVANAFHNRPFMVYAISFFFFTIGFLAAQRALPYWAELGLGGDEGTVTLLMIPFLLTALASYAVIPYVARRLHVKWMMVVAFLIIGSGLPWMYVIGVSGLSTSAKMISGALLFGYCGIGQGIMYVMMMPMLGQAIDYDEARTGHRREALYNGLSGVAWKAAMGGSIAIASLSMRYGGHSVDHATGVFLVGPIAGLFAASGLIAMLFYPVLRSHPSDAESPTYHGTES